MRYALMIAPGIYLSRIGQVTDLEDSLLFEHQTDAAASGMPFIEQGFSPFVISIELAVADIEPLGDVLKNNRTGLISQAFQKNDLQ